MEMEYSGVTFTGSYDEVLALFRDIFELEKEPKESDKKVEFYLDSWSKPENINEGDVIKIIGTSVKDRNRYTVGGYYLVRNWSGMLIIIDDDGNRAELYGRDTMSFR